MRLGFWQRLIFRVTIFGFFLLLNSGELKAQTGTQWTPYMEWSVENETYSGNPFDVTGSVTFTHSGSGGTKTSLMFYDTTAAWQGWKFRFTGVRTGTWTYLSSSDDPDLDGLSGAVTINENSNPNVHGFIKNFDSKWGWEGTETAFVPQVVMFSTPLEFYNNTSYIDAKIDTFFIQHGFNGFHVRVYCQWFDLENAIWDGQVDNANPDIRTFRALEDLITKTHAAGGMVHLWMWGENPSHTSIDYPLWGKNGVEDQRLQRYIAARLGPLPGWSMGYGYDLDEWAAEADLETWHTNMQQFFGGWHHFLGGRDPNPNTSEDPVTQIYEGLDYSGYEQWKPPYSEYVRVIDARPLKPSFSEDRFRIRLSNPDKDYTEPETRRGLYHSTMAGGVANIWGNFIPYTGEGYSSWRYSHPEWISTWSQFYKDRFISDMVRDNDLTDGMCLRRSTHTQYIFYKEDASSINMDLTGMPGPRYAIAVNSEESYTEIELGWLQPKDTTLNLSPESDWVIAVGFLPGCYLEARIFMEGAYETVNGNMNTDLNDASILPFTAPYDEDPRSVDEIPDDIVDWVLVQLRETPDGEVIACRSVFLRKDGYIVADDGKYGVWMDTDPGEYYVIIRHRDHLSVMSSEPVTVY